MSLVRFAYRDGRQDVGVLDGDAVTPLGVGSFAELLHWSLDDIRTAYEYPAGFVTARDAVRLLPPVDGRMEVWAAGVTYKTSQTERMKESQAAASVYDRVYDAVRPELFFKSAAWRVVGDGEPISVRADSAVDVPEPELAVVLNAGGDTVGYTICNDVSSRTIEGDNPLYLPQAKIYLGGCAVGPAVVPVWQLPDPTDLAIRMSIHRGGAPVWSGAASTSQLHRTLADLVAHLLRADAFPDGVVLSTGTCLVPELPFTLDTGDVVAISIDGIGSLTNPVVRGRDGVEWLVAAADDVRLRPSSG
ncbi:fumarylacetoacetate hydrolase family protein [Planosporangium mesophilum]|uniref:Fumarylacetoacetate (FAA) hydrolase n=1 Tax=Planosporangium mesophilum TaxID=689768 RepID=A0A8J3TNY6_9ACTN|nr:fumarylacetoacetate hydrolase family protein [Planosporangium mesophilum]NJC82970.1 fumarylacetoacetate hydrolase [Planosporangium mesophilum]GII24750.1 fumarylacetoacetate (FAA) hydrolase [Planosporangium mesophilum]